MEISMLTRITRLRIIVGFLGEQSQFNWWPSSFFTVSSRAFLSPIFSKTAFLAQYQGVKEAASRVHDDRIGIGAVYHLFRLPEHVEQALFAGLHDKEFADAVEEVQQQHLQETERDSNACRSGPNSPRKNKAACWGAGRTDVECQP